MKRIILAVSVGALFVLGLLVSACGSSSGGAADDCQKVCAKVGECGSAQDEQQCLQDCPEMAKVIRASAWSRAVDCMLNLDCNSGSDPDTCLLEAAGQEPESNIDGLANSLCTKAHECDSNAEVNTCVSEFKNDSDLQVMRIMTDEALNCIGTCVTGKSCDVIGSDIDSVFSECACGCGIGLFCE